MTSIFESVKSELEKGDSLRKLGEVVGSTEIRTKKAVDAAGPAALGKLADLSSAPQGATKVGQLIKENDESKLADIPGFIDGGGSLSGSSSVEQIFGSNRDELVSRLARKADVSSGTINKLLPMLVPIILSVLAKTRTAEGLDDKGVAGLLAAEKIQLRKKGLLTTPRRTTVVDAATKSQRKGVSWLWPAIAAIAGLVLLAWLLTQCRSDSTKSNAPSTANTSTSDASGDSATDGDDSKSSDDLQTLVNTELDGYPGVKADLDDSGNVTLTGTTDSEASKTDAEKAVQAITGVKTVDNQIQVDSSAGSGTGDQGSGSSEDPADEDTVNKELDLEPITFQVDSAQITEDGKAVLEEAAAYFKENSSVNFEIAGHTDSDGEDAANVVLSQRRADAVKQFLADQGIATDRMTAKGYGAAKPVTSNDTEADKAKNRRIEFIVTQ